MGDSDRDAAGRRGQDAWRRAAAGTVGTRLLLAAIVLVGLAVRLPSLFNSLFGDELSTYFIVTRHGPGAILHLLDGHSVDLTPPLYFLLAWLADRLGDAPAALRLVSLVAGTASVALTYRLAARTVGRGPGLVAAALMALSPFLVFFSTEARAYALVMGLVLASTLCLLAALQSGRAGLWVAYAALMCGAMYTHYTSIFVLAVQFIWAYALHPAARRALRRCAVGAAAGFAPWVPALVANSHSAGTQAFAVLEPFGTRAIIHDLARWSIGHPYLVLAAVPGTLGLLLVVAGGACALLASVAALVRRAGQPTLVRRAGQPTEPRASVVLRAPALLPVLLALATPVGLGLYSLVVRDTWDLRNLICSWPGLAVSVAALLCAVPRVRPVAVALLIAGLVIGATQLLRAADQRPDYTRAARTIATAPDRSIVAVVSAPTPGPLSAMDAALAYAGQAGRPLLRIGSPSLAAVLHAAPYALLPAVPTAALAAQADRVPPGALLFVVAPGRVAIARLLRGQAVDPSAALGPNFGTGRSGQLFATVFVGLAAFLRMTAPAFEPVATQVLPGLLPVTLYTLVRR